VEAEVDLPDLEAHRLGLIALDDIEMVRPKAEERPQAVADF
jgi:hypothetical protein